MAVIPSSLKLLKNGGAATAKGGSASGTTRAYEAEYQVQVDNPLDGSKIVQDYFRDTVGLPWINDPYQFGNDQDSTAECNGVNPTRMGLSDIFNVKVAWAQPGPGTGGSEPEKVAIDLTKQPPLLWHDEIDIGSTQTSVPIRKAKFRGFSTAGITNPGLPIGYEGAVVNSALDAYDPEPEGEMDIEVLRISRNVFPYDDTLASGFRGTVNQSDVFIQKPNYGFSKLIPMNNAKIHQFQAQFMVDLEYKVKYYRLTIEVHINKLGWRLIMIDKGLRRRANVGDQTETGVTITAATVDIKKPQLTAIRDPSGTPVTTPVLLNGNGAPLTITSPTLPNMPPPVLMFWEYYPEIDWSGIPW